MNSGGILHIYKGCQTLTKNTHNLRELSQFVSKNKYNFSTKQMLSDLEIARREREIIENLERSEQLKQQQQQQQQIWEVQEEDADSGELDDHLQYQEVGGSGAMVTLRSCGLPFSSYNSVCIHIDVFS